MSALTFTLFVACQTAVVVDEPHAIFVTDFTHVEVREETADILQGLVTAEIARTRGVSVLSTRELRATLDAAAASESGACSHDSACFAELAAGLGARSLVLGAVALSNGLLSLELSLLDLDKGGVRAREVILGRDLTDVYTRVSVASQNLLAPLTGGEKRAIPPPEPFRRFDDTSSLVAMGAIGALSGGAAALMGVLGFAGVALMATQSTTTNTALQWLGFYGALTSFGAIPFVAAGVAAMSTLVVDAFIGGDNVWSRALLTAALLVPLSVPLGGVLVASSIIGQPIGWSVGMEFALFDNDDLGERYRAMFLGGAATGALGSLLLVGGLSAAATAGLYAFGIWWLEEIEPEGDVLASLDRARTENRLAFDVE